MATPKLPPSIALGLVAVAFASSTSFAQTTGTILGQVLDATNAAVGNAVVEVQNTGTGQARKAMTNSEGTYLLPSLPPGTYNVTVTVPGFKVFAQAGITVEVGENVRVNAVLQVGAVS